ncbi:hypothetical protein [Pigmentiphaga sp.]|uniref:hypothetical protein n=1 Tax=Pigmentiphaga sp. TaxID=1977564 RepID=UPI0025FF26D3|nr:hypothetical protein [Pigmentiphaga sp.]
MEDLVRTLVGECRMQQAVAMTTVENDMRLFAYPLPDQGVLLALGVGPAATLTAEELLTRRADRLRQAGDWLPSMFIDGSLYLLRRLAAQEDGGAQELAAQLELARELLN